MTSLIIDDARPHRRQLLRLRRGARAARVQVRRAPLPHQVRARVGVRAALLRVDALRPPREGPRARPRGREAARADPADAGDGQHAARHGNRLGGRDGRVVRRGARQARVGRAAERRGGRALARGPRPVREDLQALHEEAVGQVPVRARRRRVLLRLPCRTTTDDRYFGDQYQALPKRGYTRIFENMLLDNPLISIRVNCDFFAERAAGRLPKYGMLVYTGPDRQLLRAAGHAQARVPQPALRGDLRRPARRGRRPLLPGGDGRQLPVGRRAVHAHRRVQARAEPAVRRAQERGATTARSSRASTRARRATRTTPCPTPATTSSTRSTRSSPTRSRACASSAGSRRTSTSTWTRPSSTRSRSTTT